jgi:hypothetical protein
MRILCDSVEGMKKQRFKIRATITGRGIWTCPDCGHQSALVIAPKSRWRVQCKKGTCQHVFRIGMIFYRLGPGQGRTGRPPDTLLPESIPESRLAPRPYRAMMPVHMMEEATTPHLGED